MLVKKPIISFPPPKNNSRSRIDIEILLFLILRKNLCYFSVNFSKTLAEGRKKGIY